MPKELKNHIVEEDGKFKLLSHDGKNLGVFDTREEAEKHEGQVEYFKEKHNAVTQMPSFFYAKHMQPGTCKYDSEIVLVDTDALQSMAKTGPGIPVYIHHQPNVALDDMKEKAVGYVTESFYNELDGWLWFKFMAMDDEARLAISNGWSVSNAYRPTQWGNGGTKNNVPYDREIVSGGFTHLAIVPNPRYEDACIMTPEEFKNYQDGKKQKLSELQNSMPNNQPSKGNPMLKLFRKKTEEVTNAADATHVELEDGKLIPVSQMMNAMKKNEGDGKEKDSKKDDDKDDKMNESVDVDGEKMPLRELINRYSKMNEKKNADEKEAKEKEEKEKENKAEEEKKNAEEEAKKKKDEDEKTNGKGFYDQILNAHKVKPDTIEIIESPMTQTARGAARYGSAK